MTQSPAIADPACALITGAGSGLGAALAHRYAIAGYHVLVTDAIRERAEQVAQDISDTGGRATPYELDVSSSAQWNELAVEISARALEVSILINNAGVAAAGRLEDSTLDDWRWVMETNLMGVVNGCHHFLPLLRARGHGHIINVASFAGMIPVPELSVYCTAKSAVVALSEQLRVDLDGSGVSVHVLCPAFVQTGLLETMRTTDKKQIRQAERWMKSSRIGPSDVAETVYKSVERDRFLILTHGETRWALRVRRWFPGLYHRLMVSMARKLNRGKGAQ